MHHTRMRLTRKVALLWAVFTLTCLTGCRNHDSVPTGPMPPNTVLLSEVMRGLSARPGFTESLLQQLQGLHGHAGKRGPALLTPHLIDELRQRILGKDWRGLDRFPGWTMRQINPTVRLADRLVGDNSQLEGMSAVHPGARAPQLDTRKLRDFLDVGPYSLDRAQTIALDEPTSLPGFSNADNVTQMARDLQRGDGPNDLAPEHAESARLAFVLNRLSANRLNGVAPFRVTLKSFSATSPDGLLAMLRATGYSVSVTDSRYFANFGHLHFKGQDVMMPFWIDTQIAVPGTGGLFRRPRSLLVPVSHAEFEWHVRGSHLAADVSHYFGVDGKAEWRTMDTLDQAWVLKRNAHTYIGEQAQEATRLTSLITAAYMHQHLRRPELAFGGYYTLGVCQDPVSAVEKRLTGRSTLFPNTANSSLFDDPRDSEVNAMFAAIPKDRAGAEPQPERIFGSLPAEPGKAGDFKAITIPGLAADLAPTYRAWQEGHLHRTHGLLWHTATRAAGVAGMALLGLAGALLVRRRRT